MDSTETTVTTKLMTAEEFAEFVHRPENTDKWFELVRGEAIELPPPFKRHGFVSVNIGRILGNYTFQVGHGYVTGNDTGVLLERDPDTVRGPDVAFYEDAQHYLEMHPKYGEAPPLLAVEVLSSSDTYKRVSGKIAGFLKTGVKVVWVVDPEEQTMTVYRPGGQYTPLTGDQEVTGDPELPGFKCLVGDFFKTAGDVRRTQQPPAA